MIYGWKHDVSYALIDNANFDVDEEVKRIGMREFRRNALMYGWPADAEPTWSVVEIDEPEREVELDGEIITLPPLRAREWRWTWSTD